MEDYLLAEEGSSIPDIEIKYVLKQATTDDVYNRDLYMKGVDHCYDYEGHHFYRTDDL